MSCDDEAKETAACLERVTRIAYAGVAAIQCACCGGPLNQVDSCSQGCDSDLARAVERNERIPEVGRKLKEGFTGAEIVGYRGSRGERHTGVWKPLLAQWGPRDVAYCHDGNGEVAAFRLAGLLGVGVVPETVFDWANGGTVQQFLEPATLACLLEPQEQMKLLQQQPERVAVIGAVDVILGNTDRREANYLFVGENQVLWGIDNGHAMWTRYMDNQDCVRRNYLVMRALGVDDDSVYWVTMDAGRFEFPPELVERWRGITRAEFDQAMRGICELPLGRVNVDNAWDNLQHICEHGAVVWEKPGGLEEMGRIAATVEIADEGHFLAD